MPMMIPNFVPICQIVQKIYAIYDKIQNGHPKVNPILAKSVSPEFHMTQRIHRHQDYKILINRYKKSHFFKSHDV